MRHIITRALIGTILTGAAIYMLATGNEAGTFGIIFGLAYCGSAALLWKKNKDVKSNENRE